MLNNLCPVCMYPVAEHQEGDERCNGRHHVQDDLDDVHGCFINLHTKQPFLQSLHL